MAAILFPVFARARENARRTSCLSNLKQIGLTVTMYQQDYDGIIVPVSLGYQDTAGTPTTHEYNRCTVPSYYDLLDPYAKNRQIFRCPTIKRGPNPAQPVSSGCPASGASNAYLIGRKFTYGMNVGTVSGGSCDGPGRSYLNCGVVKEGALSDPARTIYMGETYGLANGPTNVEQTVWFIKSSLEPGEGPSAGSSPIVDYRHLETANFLFCDGHAKSLAKGAALQLQWTIN